MNPDSAHKSGWETTEAVFGIPFLLSLILHFLVPISFPSGTLRLLLVPVGIVLLILGLAVIVTTRREFARYRQPTDPGRPTSQVIKTGPFSISRNPLYLGAAILLLGIALAFHILCALPALLFSLILCHYVLVAPEEKYLTAKFGDEYLAYAAVVRRWLGRR